MARQGQLAEDIRARLEPQGLMKLSPQLPKPTPSVLDQRWMGKMVRLHVQEFACLFAIIALAVSGLLLWNGHAPGWPLGLFGLAAALILLGYRAPIVLHPFWKAWMALAEKLGCVSSFIILSLAWVLMVVPMGLLLRVIKKRLMVMTFREPVQSYWEDREENSNDFVRLERQF